MTTSIDCGPVEALIERLTQTHGELIGGAALAHCLGYRTAKAFQVAARLGTLPVPTFELKGRRGRYALTEQVARWLASLGHSPNRDQVRQHDEEGDQAPPRV